MPPGGDMVRRVIQFSPPTRFGERYRADLAAAPNLLTLLHANVVDLAASDNAAEVAGLTLATLDGKRHRLTARCSVRAAGGIHHARMMLLSNGGQPHGRGNGRARWGNWEQ